MKNSFLSEWNTPFGIAPFDQISDADFAPALEIAMQNHRAELDAITSSRDTPDFANTIEAIEASGADLQKVLSVFYAVAGSDSNETREALQRDFSPKLAAHFSEISSNKKLFKRIVNCWEQRDSLNLNAEQQRVLTLTHRSFVRAGAALKGEQETRLREIISRLAVLGTQFTQNLLVDERNWYLELAETDLEGLPDFAIAAARTAGEEKGLGPLITTSRSIITPFLQFSPRRDLRQKAYSAWIARGANGGDTDNRAVATEILALREERAQLLGYTSFAEYKLETEMAKTPAAVRSLLMDVWTPAKARANSDANVLEDMLHADGIEGPLLPWDWHYYSSKRRKAEHDLDEAMLKPYLQLERMIEAAFACASRLFGLQFKPLDVSLYHTDCRAWEVTRDAKHVAVFIGDYFARSSKRSGAWCSALRAQSRFPKEQTPIVINVCNFAKGEPSLLSFEDARTLFHEFGHTLHHMLSNVTYESISGTAVALDFVELPSQLYEHWLEVPEVLSEFAIHAQTGEPMPQEMLEKLLSAATFDMGFATMEYVASALVDLELHNGPAPADVMQMQAEVLENIGMHEAISMRHATPHFAHVFAGDGYASGYYSYMWSEVMDADAFASFEEVGNAFDPERAKSLEDNILSTGASQDAQALYLAFRGKLPQVEALLKGRGLI